MLKKKNHKIKLFLKNIIEQIYKTFTDKYFKDLYSIFTIETKAKVKTNHFIRDFYQLVIYFPSLYISIL